MRILYKALAIGSSAGGIEALNYLLPNIPANSIVPVFIVQHVSSWSNSHYIDMLGRNCKVLVKVAEHGEEIKPGIIYVAPPDFHLRIESGYTLSLHNGERRNYSRPSIDELFESGAEVYQQRFIGMVLTGANSDGSRGMLKIQNAGGITIVQNPDDAFISEMPKATLRLIQPKYLLTLEQIGWKLKNINMLF